MVEQATTKSRPSMEMVCSRFSNAPTVWMKSASNVSSECALKSRASEGDETMMQPPRGCANFEMTDLKPVGDTESTVTVLKDKSAIVSK